jgi:hypothetical protein
VQYTWHEIEQDWLRTGGKLAVPNDEVVRTFNMVAARFGRDWVEASRTNNGAVSDGTSPTLFIVTLGWLLDSLGDAPNAHGVREKVKNGDTPARAELVAIHLVRSGTPDTDLEIEPEVVVGTKNRKPDFRVRRGRDDWTYVEVTQASTSEAQANVRRNLERLTILADDSTGTFGLEVFLRREPTHDEVDAIAVEIVQGHIDTTTRAVELVSGLGTLYWDIGEPQTVVLDDHGEPYTPRLGMTRFAKRGDNYRRITVRWPFTDERAEEFLRIEARQLPTNAPGLIMINTGYAVGAMKAWRSLIERRFQPNLYTRVSAVCLFSSGHHGTDAGEEWRPQTKLIINPHARIPLPDWLRQQLERFPSSEADIGQHS